MIKLNVCDGYLICDERRIPVMGEYDVVVAGGGMAGCGAALAAAKNGASTVIIENSGGLGGLATNGIVNIPHDFVSGVGSDFQKRLTDIGGLRRLNSDPEKHKLILDRMMSEYGVKVLLVTPVIDAIVDGDDVKGVVVYTKSGCRAILGKVFVDATGDSDVAFLAGAETMTGRPEDGISMACSLDFVMGGVDFDKYAESDFRLNDPKWVKLIKKALEDGKLPYEIDNHLNWMTHIPSRPEHCGMDEVGICFAHSRNCRPTDNEDLTRMYIEGREQCAILADFIRENIPGFEHAYLSYTGSLLGVRESRRIKGEYVFTGMDIAYARRFDDVVAISQHGFDMHGFTAAGNLKWFKGNLPDGREAYISNRAGWGTQLPPEDGLPRVNMIDLTPDGEFWYDIPYRSLVPEKINNLLAAGRNISADVPGQSGTRLIMCCMSLGEAAGTAAAMCAKDVTYVRNIDVGALQRRLDENGCNIGQSFRTVPAIGDNPKSKFVGFGRRVNCNG